MCVFGMQIGLIMRQHSPMWPLCVGFVRPRRWLSAWTWALAAATGATAAADRLAGRGQCWLSPELLEPLGEPPVGPPVGPSVRLSSDPPKQNMQTTIRSGRCRRCRRLPTCSAHSSTTTWHHRPADRKRRKGPTSAGRWSAKMPHSTCASPAEVLQADDSDSGRLFA